MTIASMQRFHCRGSLTLVKNHRPQTVTLDKVFLAFSRADAIQSVAKFLNIPAGEAGRLVPKNPIQHNHSEAGKPNNLHKAIQVLVAKQEELIAEANQNEAPADHL